jgi:hypothetical protein
MNFFLLFEALEIYSGEFVFTIWYTGVPGRGDPQPTTPDLTDYEPIVNIPEPTINIPEPTPEPVENNDQPD